jgi:hypothetical protein
MKSAFGIEYAEAAKEIVLREVQGCQSLSHPRLLWRTEKPSRRPKDAEDLMFLQRYFREHGEELPRA